MHVCMYACMHVCMYVCMYVRTYVHVCKHACVSVRTYLTIHNQELCFTANEVSMRHDQLPRGWCLRVGSSLRSTRRSVRSLIQARSGRFCCFPRLDESASLFQEVNLLSSDKKLRYFSDI